MGLDWVLHRYSAATRGSDETSLRDALAKGVSVGIRIALLLLGKADRLSAN
jgi:hypothetical protein